MANFRSLPSTLLTLGLVSFSSVHAEENQTLVFEGKQGPGKGKHIVFLAGDEEYRSEEGLPQLAKILAERQGFKCTVCFSINKNGEIDPNTGNNEPGIEALDTADACVMLLRFRAWPEAQMKHFVDYYQAGKPFIALRTSTHAFNFPGNSPYSKFTWNNKEWPGGFGRQVLGETWINHWGGHKSQATHPVIEPSQKDNPLLRGVSDIFVTTDVYEAEPQDDVKVLLRGQVLSGMKPTDAPATNTKKRKDGTEQGINDPMMPIAWTREAKNESGKTNKVLCMTMGAASDLPNEDLRRLIVNGVFWECGLEVPAKADVSLVGDFQPTFYGFNGGKKGVKPADLQAK